MFSLVMKTDPKILAPIKLYKVGLYLVLENQNNPAD